MARTTFTRWSPDTCECVIELETDFDDVLVPGMIINEPRFCLMNHICDDHAQLKSTTFRDNHAELSTNVLKIIERAKSDNLKQVDDLIASAQTMTKGKSKMLRELQISRQTVVQFNADLDEEWNELVSFPEAFDEHIHDTILQEEKAKLLNSNG